MVLKHLPHAWGLVGIQPYSEARVTTRLPEGGGGSQVVMIFSQYTCPLPTDLHSFPGLLSSFFLLRAPERWKKWKSLLSLLAEANQPLRTYVFLGNQSRMLSPKSPWQIPRMPDSSFAGSGQYCFLITTTILMTSMMTSDLMQKKTAYSLAGGMPRTLMKRLENK